QCDGGAEGVAGDTDTGCIQLREPAQVSERRPHIILLADAAVVLPFPRTNTAEVEAQRGDSLGDRGLADGVDDVVLHVATVHRVRVTDDDPGRRSSPRKVQQPFELRAL